MEGTVAFHRSVIRPTRPTDIFEMPRGSCGRVGGHKEARGGVGGERGGGGKLLEKEVHFQRSKATVIALKCVGVVSFYSGICCT